MILASVLYVIGLLNTSVGEEDRAPTFMRLESLVRVVVMGSRFEPKEYFYSISLFGFVQ